MFDDLYRENIIQHYKHPQNYGVLENADINMHAKNPSCGDELFLFLQTQDGKIKDIKWKGEGCAISQAATSMLSQEIKNKSLQEISKMSEQDIRDMLGVDISPARQKCAFLSLTTLQENIA